MDKSEKKSFWQTFSEDFKDIFYTKEEIEFRKLQYQKSIEDRDLSIDERIAKAISEYKGFNRPNTIYLGSGIVFQIRLNLLSTGINKTLDDISDIKVMKVYGLNVIEVHSKPNLINVAYIKDI